MITQARVLGAEDGGGVTATLMPECCSARNRQPSHKMVKETLLRCLSIRLTHGEGRKAVSSRFDDAIKEGKGAAPVRCTSVALLCTGLKVHCLPATMLQAYVYWTLLWERKG